MMLKRIILLFIFVILFFNPKKVVAVEDPLSVPNNIYGIHILDENDLEDASKLVNSNGGDWGYVTIVIRSDERDHKRWQTVFNKMRELHLIPILRIATKQSEDGWEKPKFDEIDGWVGFLNSLNWVVKNRYVIIGNVPNHAKEWGGEIRPDEYSIYLSEFSKKLKKSSNDYYVLQAGFDASSPDGEDTMSEDTYIQKMFENNPDLFDHIDGWASHS